MGVNKVIYNGKELIDLTGDTVSPETLAKGITAHDMAGNKITGTMVEGGGVTAGKSYRLMVKDGSSVFSFQYYFNVFSGLAGIAVAIQEVIVDAQPDVDILGGLGILGFYIVTGGDTPSVYVGTGDTISDFINGIVSIWGNFSVLAPYNGVANSEEEMTSNGTWLLIQDENQVVTEYGNGAYVALDGMKFRTIDMLPQVKELNISQATNFNSPDELLGIVADEGRHLQAVAVKNSRAGKTYDITRNGTHSGLLGYDEVSVNVQPSLQHKSVTLSNGVHLIKPTESYDGLASVEVIVSDRIKSVIRGGLIPITKEDLDGVTELRPYAFAGFWLNSIDIPNSVTSIGVEAFYNCKVSSVTIPNSIAYIGNRAFYNCSIISLIFEENSKLETINSETFSTCSKLTSITIPDSVTYIDNWAFRNCGSLTSVTIPDSVTYIGEMAFYNCALTSVMLGKECRLGRFVFGNNLSLTNIEVDENNSGYKSISGNLYNKAGTKLIQYAIGKKDTSFIVPSSVISIGEGAFAYCDNLTSVTLQDNVKSIGYTAFESCSGLKSIYIGNGLKSIAERAFAYNSNLTDIYYNGTISEWEAIEKDKNWGSFGSMLSPNIHCTDGTIAKS